MAGGDTSVLSAGLRHQLNLLAHYPPRPSWGTDKCTLGPQAKLIHLASFCSGTEEAAAWRKGEGGIDGERQKWPSRRADVPKGSVGRVNSLWVCCSPVRHSEITYKHFFFP